VTNQLDELRTEFVRLMVEDSKVIDGFNQAIFDGPKGYAVWVNTELVNVIAKFDKAVNNLRKR
jgi:hypothetical protein